MKNAHTNTLIKKETGRVYTPDYIVNSILDLSGYSGHKIIKKHVIDNSCGDGAFISEVIKRYCDVAIQQQMPIEELKHDLSIYIHGIELEPSECEKCVVSAKKAAALFDIYDVEWDFVCGDSLNTHRFDGAMDFVVGNPPYVRVHNLEESLKAVKKFSFAQNGMTDLFIVFYEIGIRMLANNGVLGYITPSSFFNSLAGTNLRKELIQESLLKKVVDLKHYQAFSATTYTTIIILQKNNERDLVEFYRFDENKKRPVFSDKVTSSDYYIGGNFYFADRDDLSFLRKIYSNLGRSDIEVKNGYATLCDNVFVGDFDFDSSMIIPVVKSSRGIKQKIIFPYDRSGRLLPESNVKKDTAVYEYLSSNREKLIARSNEQDAETYWYAFGRSQAILDTFRDKLAINALMRDERDLKFVEAPAGVGVYGGLYIVSETIAFSEIKEALFAKEFAKYVSLLSKYKSGGYYTFSSKDLKIYLDYKFAYDGGLFYAD